MKNVRDKRRKEAAKSEKEVKKLVSPRLHKWIHVFKKKASKRILIRKMQDYAIDVKKVFVLRKRKVYLLSREEREEMYKFIDKKLSK